MNSSSGATATKEATDGWRSGSSQPAKDTAMSLPEFDELVALAKSDPEALEKLRREKVEEIIESARTAGLKRRLRGLQFQIDAKVRLSRTPMAACVTLSQMMQESLNELRLSLMGRECPKGDSSMPPVTAQIYQLEI